MLGGSQHLGRYLYTLPTTRGMAPLSSFDGRWEKSWCWWTFWKGGEGNNAQTIDGLYISHWRPVQNFPNAHWTLKSYFLFGREVTPSILGNVGTEKWKRIRREHEACISIELKRTPKGHGLSFRHLVYQPRGV